MSRLHPPTLSSTGCRKSLNCEDMDPGILALPYPASAIQSFVRRRCTSMTPCVHSLHLFFQNFALYFQKRLLLLYLKFIFLSMQNPFSVNSQMLSENTTPVSRKQEIPLLGKRKSSTGHGQDDRVLCCRIFLLLKETV